MGTQFAAIPTLPDHPEGPRNTAPNDEAENLVTLTYHPFPNVNEALASLASLMMPDAPTHTCPACRRSSAIKRGTVL